MGRLFNLPAFLSEYLLNITKLLKMPLFGKTSQIYAAFFDKNNPKRLFITKITKRLQNGYNIICATCTKKGFSFRLT